MTTEATTIIAIVYVFMAVVVFNFNLAAWLDERDYRNKEDARSAAINALMAPVWPVLVLGLIIQMIKYIKETK